MTGQKIVRSADHKFTDEEPLVVSNKQSRGILFATIKTRKPSLMDGGGSSPLIFRTRAFVPPPNNMEDFYFDG